MPQTHRVAPGSRVDLTAIPTRADSYHDDKDRARQEFKHLREELVEWQRRLYAEGRRRLLIVLQAMDAGGKDGTIKKLFRGVNPQGIRVESFKAPGATELSYDFLWRVHRVVPATGYISIFNRSHYEDVLVVRVDKLAPEEVWRPRYRQINDFERLLVESGTEIFKFYLHISPEEQKRRFRARLHDPLKQWKFSLDDLDKAREWDAYRAAYEEMLERCSTEVAPWHVIPADQKWYRNLAIARTVVGRLREMKPDFPSHGYDPAEIEIA